MYINYNQKIYQNINNHHCIYCTFSKCVCVYRIKFFDYTYEHELTPWWDGACMGQCPVCKLCSGHCNECDRK